VEAATYGLEFMTARTAMEQIMDLRLTIHYLGIPIKTMTYLFGENNTVVDSSMFPHSRLHIHHQMLSFHWVMENIAAKVIHFVHIPGMVNPADILSKACGYQQVWEML